MNISDDKLEKYINNINLNKSILENYDKATKRLNFLKKKFNNTHSVFLQCQNINNENNNFMNEDDENDNDNINDNDNDNMNDDDIKNKKKINYDNLTIEELIEQLTFIKNKLDEKQINFSIFLNLFVKYQQLIKSLELKKNKLENEFYTIEKNNQNITLNKIDIDEII
jgi:hypothetical protein